MLFEPSLVLNASFYPGVSYVVSRLWYKRRLRPLVAMHRKKERNSEIQGVPPKMYSPFNS